MKWNWGTKIGLVFSAFVILMIFMVVKSFQTDFHLVTEEYYQEELKYQERIDQVNNARDLAAKPIVEVGSEDITIKFVNTFDDASIHFYRPDNANFDKTYKLEEENTFSVSKTDLVAGRYLVKITWREGATSYFLENEVFINK